MRGWKGANRRLAAGKLEPVGWQHWVETQVDMIMARI